MKILGIRAHDFPEGTFDELTLNVLKNDLNSVQLSIAKAIKGNLDLSLETANELNKAFKDDVKVSVFSCYINPSIPDEIIRKRELEKFKNHLKFASIANLKRVGTETGSFYEDCSYCTWNESDVAYKICKESFKELLEYAKEVNVKIAIEPVVRHVINSIYRLEQLIDDVDNGYIDIIFDPSNLITEENYKNQASLFEKFHEKFSDKVKVIHLKDFVIKDNKMEAITLGEGLLELEKLFNLFPNAEYVLDEIDANDIIGMSKKIKAIYKRSI